LGKLKGAISGATETISSRSKPVNGESTKKVAFERKYDISILGNIYISAAHAFLAATLVRLCAITLTYKAI
jgi:hypothetical protein